MHPPDSLTDLLEEDWNWIDFEPRDCVVCLDGWYTINDLKLIIKFMEENRE